MNPQSIFKFVQDHINEEGRFTADFLPDDPSPPYLAPLVQKTLTTTPQKFLLILKVRNKP